MVHNRYSIVHVHVVISYNHLYVQLYIYVIFQTPLKNSKNYFIDTINYIVQSCNHPSTSL